MNSELMIYQQNNIKTYLHFIKENLTIIPQLYEDKISHLNLSLAERSLLYKARARHLQIMSLIGITAEHLIKLILLKRGFVLNAVKPLRFNKEYMEKLENYNSNKPSQEKLDLLYGEADKSASIEFSERLISFEECCQIFKKSNDENYFNGIKELRLNENFEEYSYLGYTKMTGDNCLKIIQQMRNSYLHKAESQSEMQGIIWYMYNFLVWTSKKEFFDFFKDEQFIGTDENKALFQNATSQIQEN